MTRDVAGKVRLADVLPTQLSSRADQPEVELARNAWQIAQPSVAAGRTPGQAIDDLKPGAIVGIPGHVQRHADLGSLRETFEGLSRKLSNNLSPVDAVVIASTDDTALTIARSFDLMPLFGLPEIAGGWRTYARNAGRNLATGADSSLLTTVYRAEATALQYERRLEAPELLNQDFRPLNPLLVFAMQRPEVVEAFALGVAADWIKVAGEEVSLQVPGGAAIPVLPAPGSHHPLVAALLGAVATWDTDTPAWRQLQATTANPSAGTQQAWRGFIDAVRGIAPAAPPPPTELRCENGHPMKPGDNFCGVCRGRPTLPPPAPTRRPRPFAGVPDGDVQDLVAVATLEAYRRLAGPAAWDQLVMEISRTAQ